MSTTATRYDEVAAATWELAGTELLAEALAGRGAREWGLRFAPAASWNVGERRTVPLTSGQLIQISHDEREAPVPLRGDGCENQQLLVSLTDEDGTAACAWARMECGSSVVGIGVDLASIDDFSGARGRRFNPLLFTEHEHELVHEACTGAGCWAADESWAYAFAFSAKEAAFKACAAPLRRWYSNHEERLGFDVRCFELIDWSHEAGTARHSEAQRAMDSMGIHTIELSRMACGNMALTLAVALDKVA